MSETFSVWFLIGAALVFWMQAGFAMVEHYYEKLNGFLYWDMYIYFNWF